jgi:hypothetical protein
MFKKITQRVPVGAADPVSGQSVRNRLFEVVSEIRPSEGVASQESVSVLLEVIERLRKIERLLSDNGFFPFREIPAIVARSRQKIGPPRSLDEAPRDPSNREFGSGERARCENGETKRRLSLWKKQSREMTDSTLVMISITYHPQCETFRFGWRKLNVVFAVFGSRRGPNATGRRRPRAPASEVRHRVSEGDPESESGARRAPRLWN